MTKNGNNKLRIGVVGLGRVATATHIPVLNFIDDVEITACAETNMDRVNRVKEIFKIPVLFNDYREMYRSKLIDAVFVCVPPHAHYDATIAALQSGIHVLCEKPMGRNLNEAIQMNSVAQKNNVILMPGFKSRYNRGIQEARKIISNSLLGKIIQVEATFMTPGPYISWDPKSEWYFEADQGGVVYDIGVHIVDLLHYLVPQKIRSVHAVGSQGYYEYDIPTNVTCAFVMDDEITGAINFGWRAAVDFIRISICGTAGVIVVGSKGVDYYNAGTDPKDRILNHMRTSFLELKSGLKRIISIFRGTEVDVNDLAQAKAFIKAIKTGKDPSVSAESAIFAHRVLDGINRSLKSKDSISI